MKLPLSQICDIRFGFYAQSETSGGVPYLQIRQFDEQGVLQHEPSEFLKLDDKTKQHQLRDGDVLFVGKGSRLFAWCYEKSAGPYIASSIFFVLHPDTAIISPDYLAIILNAPKTRSTFLQIGGGTSIFSIRKSELGALEIPVPALTEQRKIAALSKLHQEDLALTERLIAKKKNLYHTIISKLTS